MTTEQLLQQHRLIAHLMKSMAMSRNAKIEYHLLAGAVYWSDELPPNLDWPGETSMRPVLRYRTTLLLGKPESQWEAFWSSAKMAFPSWIGFDASRCTFTEPLAQLIVTGRTKVTLG